MMAYTVMTIPQLVNVEN